MTVRRPASWVRRTRRDDVHRNLLEHLSAAMTVGDGDGIRAVLRRGVELVIDSGKEPASRGRGETSDGRDAAVVVLRALATAGTTIALASVNSVLGLVLMRANAVVGVITAQTRGRGLSHVWVVTNPVKLQHWNR